MASPKGSKQKKPKKKTTSRGHAIDDGSARSTLLDRIRHAPEFEDTIVLDSHPDVQKMSAVLLEYAEPLTKPLPVHDDEAFRKAIGIAIMCWNTALSTRKVREETLRQFVSMASKDEVLPTEELLSILNFMIQRKNELFKHNKRWILNYEVKSTKRDRHVYVVSSLEQKQVKSLLPAENKPWWKRFLFWTN